MVKKNFLKSVLITSAIGTLLGGALLALTILQVIAFSPILLAFTLIFPVCLALTASYKILKAKNKDKSLVLDDNSVTKEDDKIAQAIEKEDIVALKSAIDDAKKLESPIKENSIELKSHAKKNSNSYYDETPETTHLIKAIKSQNKDIIDLMFSKSTNINQKDTNSNAPIFEIIRLNDNSLREEILAKYDFDLNITNENGETPLTYATKNKDQNIIRTLLSYKDKEKKADIINQLDDNGKSPLFYAIDIDDPDLIEMLKGNLADIKKTNISNETPLEYAKKNGKAKTTNFLETLTTAIDDDYNKEEPLIFSIIYNDMHIPKIGSTESKLDHNTINTKKETPITYAARTGKIDSIKQLLDTGTVSINSQDQNGNTAIMAAVKAGNENLVKDLFALSKEIDTKKKNSDDQSISDLIPEENKHAINLLIEQYESNKDRQI